MTKREAFYSPEHCDESDGELSSSYGVEYQDSLEDEVKQALRDGTIKALIFNKGCKEVDTRQLQLLTTIFCSILDADKPRLEIQCICIAIGLNTLIGDKSGQKLAVEYGMTRQNIAEKVKKYRNKFGLTNKTRTAKSDNAKASYKKFNRVREKETK